MSLNKFLKLFAFAFLLISFFSFTAIAEETKKNDETATVKTESQKEVMDKEASDGHEPVTDPGSNVADLKDISLQNLLFPTDYGKRNSRVDLHAYLNFALWAYNSQAWGDYANVGSSISGHPTFMTYSGYVDIRGHISKTLMAELEFELYKGEKGEFKVTRLRGVWKPCDYFQLSLGRDFPPIGIQDKVYYPPSQYRLFANAPYLYWAIIRATGWWDAGIHLSFKIPLKKINFLSKDSAIKVDFSVINGPGDEHQNGTGYLLGKMTPNAQGYMFEGFHNKARQPWDNNAGKYYPLRVAFVPIKNMEFGGSFMMGKYDADGLYDANYYFAHFLYGGERLTVAAEFGQLDIDVDPTNMQTSWNTANGTYQATKVSQRSYYISAGYKVLYKMFLANYLEPVFRFEFMDPWTQDSTDRGDRYAIYAGLRYSPTPNWVIKTSYLWQYEPGPELDNNGFIMEAVFDF